MKNVQLFTNNVLIKIETTELKIALPDAKDGKISEHTKLKKITVLEGGELVKDVVKGDEVVLGIDPLKSCNPYNNFIGAKEDANLPSCSVYYFFIKEFDIIAKF